MGVGNQEGTVQNDDASLVPFTFALHINLSERRTV